MTRFVDFDNCECGDAVKHRYLGLCSSCYKKKRKQDWHTNEQKRRKNPEYVKSKKEYARKAYNEKYRDNRLVDKNCSCGKKAIKGSRYSFCKDCSAAHHAKKKVEYQAKRKKSHLSTKIRENIKSRFKKAFGTKSQSIVKYLGCSIEELKVHLESQFQPGMSWENYGDWHIDHIVPLSTDYNNLLLHHYNNLQPLWKEDHFVKTAKENGQALSKTIRTSP